MKFTRQRYQSGSLTKEKRKAGPAVWIFRWRENTPDGRINRKVVVGTVKQLTAKTAARKAAEPLRTNAIADNPAVPMTVKQLVKHYTANELLSKAHSHTTNRRDIFKCLGHSEMGRTQTLGCTDGCSRKLAAWTFAGERNKGQGQKRHARGLCPRLSSRLVIK